MIFYTCPKESKRERDAMTIDQEKLIEFLQYEREYEKFMVDNSNTLAELDYHKGWDDALKYVLKCVECNMIR